MMAKTAIAALCSAFTLLSTTGIASELERISFTADRTADGGLEPGQLALLIVVASAALLIVALLLVFATSLASKNQAALNEISRAIEEGRHQ